MRGFPHDLSAVDYDTAVIEQKAAILEADYIAKAPMAHFSYDDQAEVFSLDNPT